MPPKSKEKTPKVQVTLTPAQLNMLDDLVKEGVLGGNRAEVMKQLFLNHMHDKKSRGLD